MTEPATKDRAPIRLAHFSDIHVTTQPLGWRPADWFSKRVATWLNLRCLGREWRFRRADEVLAALVAELRRRLPDRVIFSGDATALGFQAEVIHAAQLLGLEGPEPFAGLAVPGNHDYCTHAAESAGHFERHFSAWQVGERIDDAAYPFAQRVGHVWLVAVNTARANRWAWDASGGVGREQLQRLERLLERLAPGPRILVTHYPVCLANGQPETRTHGLRDLNALVTVAARGGIGLWLHGHRHGAYHVPAPGLAPFPVICAGSATQRGLWSYFEYTIAGGMLQAVQRTFDGNRGGFLNGIVFELSLAGDHSLATAKEV